MLTVSGHCPDIRSILHVYSQQSKIITNNKLQNHSELKCETFWFFSVTLVKSKIILNKQNIVSLYFNDLEPLGILTINNYIICNQWCMSF